MTERLVLLADRVIDSEHGEVLADRAVIVEGDRIAALVASAEAPTDQRTIDLAGHTLLAGLSDMHAHLVGQEDQGQGYASLVTRSGAQDALMGVKNARSTLHAGFTTVRDIGTFRAFADVALREAIDGGWVEGPRMACAGCYITCPGGAGDLTGLAVDVDTVVPRELRFGVTSGVDQMRTNVRQVLRYGADFIKVLATGAVLTSGTSPGLPEFTEDELRAAVEVATEAADPRGRPRARRRGHQARRARRRAIDRARLPDGRRGDRA